MTPKLADCGSSFKGAGAYYLHDKDASTDLRVAWTHTENMLTDDPEKALKVMAFTALHQAELKAAAGIKATGRKLQKPVFAFSVAWHPEQEPDRAHMLETAKAAVAALGLAEHEALYVSHSDTPHPHVHVIVNRVHPRTGLAAGLNNSRTVIQAWALAYQRERGERYCPERERNAAEREARKTARAAFRKAAGDNRLSPVFEQAAGIGGDAGGEKEYAGVPAEPAKPVRKVVRYRDPAIKDAWEHSDCGRAFAAALAAAGYSVAQGNKRLVVVDRWGKVTNPNRHLENVTAKDLRAKLKDIDLSRLPKATRIQKAIKSRRSRHEAWRNKTLNEFQDRTLKERGDLFNRCHDRTEAKRDELAGYYKPDDVRRELAALRQATAKPSLLRKLTGKAAAVRERIERLELNLADIERRTAEQVGAVEADGRRELERQAERHERERRQIQEKIVRREAELYRDQAWMHFEEPARVRQEEQTREIDRGRKQEM